MIGPKHRTAMPRSGDSRLIVYRQKLVAGGGCKHCGCIRFINTGDLSVVCRIPLRMRTSWDEKNTKNMTRGWTALL
jgi:hypothetical protein